MNSLYLWIKAFHVMAVVAWFAGSFYIFRLFVYHIEASSEDVKSTLSVMERKLIKVIMTPAMIASWILGLALVASQWPGILHQGWIHVKLLMVLILSGYHGYSSKIHKQLVAGTCRLTSKQARIINEVPALLLIVIAIMVIVKPF